MKVKRRLSKLAEMIVSNDRSIRIKLFQRQKGEKQEQQGKGQRQGHQRKLDAHRTRLNVQ